VETLKDIDHQIEQCNNARQIFANPVNTKIENLGPVINTKYDEYTPVLDALETTLIFTSRRPETTGGGIADDGKYFEDIYISNKINGQWNKPISIGSNINTEGHEATISLSADGEQLYIYRDDMGDGNIYMSKFNGDIWGKPVKLEPTVNSGARETHASVSADNNTLYFTSDREGGYGGLDIYMSKRLPNGEWGKITNLGPTINTKYDEEGPFVHPDGNTLFFSSKGHNSIGGFDIFFSVRQPDGSWIPPQNMGYPINTPDDEYFFVTSTDGKRAYFASSQPGGYGGKDIYVINLEMDPEIPLTVYKGFISSENNIVPSDVEITVTESSNPDEPYGIYRPNPRTGKFILILPSGKNYNIAYQAKGYLFFSENLNVPIETSYFVINKEIELKPIKPKGR
jgi:Tol biopolymer transport system component